MFTPNLLHDRLSSQPHHLRAPMATQVRWVLLGSFHMVYYIFWQTICTSHVYFLLPLAAFSIDAHPEFQAPNWPGSAPATQPLQWTQKLKFQGVNQTAGPSNSLLQIIQTCQNTRIGMLQRSCQLIMQDWEFCNKYQQQELMAWWQHQHIVAVHDHLHKAKHRYAMMKSHQISTVCHFGGLASLTIQDKSKTPQLTRECCAIGAQPSRVVEA